jgi:hypothetical protein
MLHHPLRLWPPFLLILLLEPPHPLLIPLGVIFPLAQHPHNSITIPGHVRNAFQFTISIPPEIILKPFNGSVPRDVVDSAEWDTLAHRAGAFLCLYICVDIYSQVVDEDAYPSVHDKWAQLQEIYSGVIGSTTVFNLWASLIDPKIDDNKPLAPQFAKLQETKWHFAMLRWDS